MNLHVDFERIRLAHKTVRAELMAERSADGIWVGDLASSPVATAAAVSALVVSHRSNAGALLQTNGSRNDDNVCENVVQGDLSELLMENIHWLARHQNQDGGWGDTPDGPSNIAATMLARAAFRLTCVPAKYAGLTDQADEYIARNDEVNGLWRRFGRDKTLTAPILATCALAGLVSWRQVPTLAFELVCLPPRWHGRLRMSVASYALASQIAVGLVKFHHDPPRNPLERRMRRWARTRSLAILNEMQPQDGGFAASIPQTAFVVMSLAAVGLQHHPIVQRGVEFLLASVRADASWPVVPNLAVWNTTLALHGLVPSTHTPAHKRDSTPSPVGGDIWQPAVGSEDRRAVNGHTPDTDYRPSDDRKLDKKCVEWLLACQQTTVPAGGKPGGWSLTDAPGALPETDDTAGALLALARLREHVPGLDTQRVEQAARRGVQWLLEQQGSDGGWSMFAHDWGISPLDRSATDLTAHALRALVAWQEVWDSGQKRLRLSPHHTKGRLLIPTAINRGIEFLRSEQRADGSFVPLRFGNLHYADERNPVYGTSRVLAAYADLKRLDSDIAQRAAHWLVAAQHTNGGWGPPRTPLETSDSLRYGTSFRRARDALAQFCTVEETALAIDALFPLIDTDRVFLQAVEKGLSWLVDAVEQDRHRRSALIGLHLAKLWYDERLYPLLFASSALARVVERLATPRETALPVA